MKKVYSYQISLKNDKAKRCVLQALAWWTKQIGVQFVEAREQLEREKSHQSWRKTREFKIVRVETVIHEFDEPV